MVVLMSLRKEFLGFRDMGIRQLYRKDLVKVVADSFAASTAYMKFLCDALKVGF